MGVWSNLTISLAVSSSATVIVTLLGLPLAWVLARSEWRGKKGLDVAVNLPLALPPTVVGYYLLLILGRSGPVGRLSQALFGTTLLFSLPAAVCASVLVSTPLFVQATRNALEGVGDDIAEAAMIDGAGTWVIFRHIYAPLSWPGILTGILLALARSFGEFGATLMVAGNIPGKTQTMSLAIYSAVQAGHYRTAHLLAAILVGVASLALWAGLRWRDANKT